jgi:tetratricopeptide (TPR) repeat protein
MKKAFLLFVLFAGLIFAGDVSLSEQKPAAGKQQEASSLRALLRSDSFLEAGKAADRLLVRRPQDPETKALCGLAVLKMGRIVEAEAIFLEVISRFPDNAEAHFGLGRIGRIRNDPETAVRHLRRAIPSTEFYDEALRQMWRASMDRGIVSELKEVFALAQERFEKDQKPLPSWLVNGFSQVSGFSGKRFFEMTGQFERMSVPLLHHEDRLIRMISLRLNGKNDYPFDIDSAAADFVTVSPLLA